MVYFMLYIRNNPKAFTNMIEKAFERAMVEKGGNTQPLPKQALVLCVCQYKSFKSTVGKGEIAHNEQFLHFQRCFLPFWRTFYHFHQI